MTDQFRIFYAIDLKTDITYGIRLDYFGKCLGVQAMTTVVRNKDGVDSVEFIPADLPFGQTISAVEMNGRTLGNAFTLVFPSRKDYDAGARPAVTTKRLPPDLIKAGIAPEPRTAVNAPVDMEAALADALKNIDHMIGLESAKHDIRQNIAVARFNQAKVDLGLTSNPISRHMVFTGNPGTGKTTFAREVAKVYKALGFIKKDTVVEVKREDLVAGYVGQTALKTKEAIEKAKGGVLFIDEAYALSRMANTPGGSNDFGREAIDTLVAAMENMREDLIVIVAGYQEPMKAFIDANEGLKSRFMTYIDFQDYNINELSQILDVMVKDRGYTLEPDARAHAIALLEKEKARVKPKDFGNGRVVRNLVEKAEKELAERLEREGKLNSNRGGLTPAQLKTELTTLKLADLKGVSLDSLGSPGGSTGTIRFGKPNSPTPVISAPVVSTPANDEPAAAPKAPRVKKPAGPKGP